MDDVYWVGTSSQGNIVLDDVTVVGDRLFVDSLGISSSNEISIINEECCLRKRADVSVMDTLDDAVVVEFFGTFDGKEDTIGTDDDDDETFANVSNGLR